MGGIRTDAAHCYGGVGGAQGGGIVDPVADHADLMAVFLVFPDDFLLVLRQKFAADGGYADLIGNSPGSGFVISGQQNGFCVHIMQLLNHRRSAFTQGIGKSDQAGCFFINSHKNNRCADIPELPDPVFIKSDAFFFQKSPFPDKKMFPLRRRLQCLFPV